MTVTRDVNGKIIYSTSSNAVHKRIRNHRGSAFLQKCIDCGKRAEQWSWIHDTDPTNTNNYEPRCTKCHCAYDGWGLKPGHTITPKGCKNYLLRERDILGRFI